MASIECADLCTNLGGEVDPRTGRCSLENVPGREKRTISRPRTFFLFAIQVIIGSATTIFNVYYSATVLPATWWVQYIILVISFLITVLIYYIKTENAGEAFGRAIISLVIILSFSTLIGSIIHWDILVYAAIESFSGEPVVTTIVAMIVSALVSFVFAETRDDDGKLAGNRASILPVR